MLFSALISNRRWTRSLSLSVLTRENHPVSRSGCHPSLVRRGALLDVEVLNIEGVVFDEFASGFDLVAHEDGEDAVGFDGVFDADL